MERPGSVVFHGSVPSAFIVNHLEAGKFMKRSNDRVRATIHLDRLAQNVDRIQEQTGDRSLLAVVKADGYGHGAVPVARTCLDRGADMLGLASTDECRHLREAGIDAPMLILGEVIEDEIPDLVEHWIRPTVQDPDRVDAIAREATRLDESLPVHLAVDTGMHRLGADPDRVPALARRITDHASLRLEGLSTHFSSAYRADGRAYTDRQLRRFNDVLDACLEQGFTFKYVHASNSGAVFRYPEAHFTMVRPGISLYGMTPGELSEMETELEPVLRLCARLLHLKEVPEGEPVGYGRAYQTERHTTVGVVSVGYNDGYPFQASGDAEVLLRGKRCPVIGRVTMDYTLIDATDVPEASVEDRVTLIGREGGEEIRAAELAQRADTISYDLLCSLSDRGRREYVSSSDEPPPEEGT